MKKKDISLEDLKVLRAFMKSKNITYRELSEEMNYSPAHVIKVFMGASGISKKFMSACLIALQGILQKDLLPIQKDILQFHRLIKSLGWNPHLW